MKLFGINLGRSATESPHAAAPTQYAPGTEISYDPQLIQRFLDHHDQLAKLVAKLRASAAASDFKATATALHDFRVLLYQHLLEENVRLYTYLGVCLRDSADDYELMQDMRGEMGRIGRTVTRFIKTYSDSGVDATNVASFREQLETIVTALNDRLRREEASLYTLYLPPAQISA